MATDRVQELRELYSESIDALSRQRRQIAEDLEFSDPSNPQQWDEDEKRRRENDPGGARPCLVLDQLGQYIGNVAGQVEKAPPGLHALPVDSGADIRVAEQMDGWFRHIEHASRAGQHYARAATAAARVGVGYLTVRPEYTDRALGYQEPRIGSEGDPLRVVLDPWSTDIDGQDADFGFVLTPYSKREFERKWSKHEAVSFDTGDYATDDDRESIIVAEAWRTDEVATNCIRFIDVFGDEVSLKEDDFWKAYQRQEVAQFIQSYKEKAKVIRWCRLSGADELEASEYPASTIGIIPVYGYIGFHDGRMTYCGIARRGRAPQQAYNYHKSEERAYIINAPKAPWIVAAPSVAPHKEIWDRASIEQRAYLPWEPFDEEGRPLPAPQRMPLAVNLQNHIQGSQEALRDIQSALGLYAASIGAPSNETSGIAIESRKQQGEASNAHFASNLSASVARVGRLCMEMVPKLIDTKRQLRTLGVDMAPSQIVVDPEQQQAVQESEQGLTINPNIGKYDVRAVVGASYSTQRTQTAEALNEVMARNPAMSPFVAPFWAKNLDFKEADKLAQVLTAMAPDPVKSILSPQQQGPSQSELIAQLQQAQQQMQQMAQMLEQANMEAATARSEIEANRADAEAKERELQIKAYEAETKRAQVVGLGEQQVAALVQQTLAQMLSQPAPMQPTDMQPFPADLDNFEGM